MKKNYNVRVEDNGAAFLIVVNAGTEQRFVVAHKSSLGDAWRHIEWMYAIESQVFTVGKKEVPVDKWVDAMKSAGYLDD